MSQVPSVVTCETLTAGVVLAEELAVRGLELLLELG